jgi:anti-sigma regulatory factor (Ser/Thr protein kinase)
MTSENYTPEVPEAVVADHCHLRIPSLPDWIEPTVDYLVNRASLCGALHPNRSSRVAMALVEAITNSVVHGNLGISSVLKEQDDRAYAEAVAARCADPQFACRMVDIRSSYDGEAIRWAITDQGQGFDVDAALRRLDEEPDLLRPSGRGLLMIRAFTDEMRYEDAGRRLLMTVRRQGEEARLQPRWPFQHTVRVAPVGEDGKADLANSHLAQARNISHGGIALLQSHFAAHGSVMITIPTPGGEPIQVPAEVRHFHALSENVLEVGCRFTAPPEQGPDTASPEMGALQELVDRIAAEQLPLAEKRGSPRLPYTECITVELPDGTETRGFGRDLSRGGIAFFATRPLPTGAVRLVLPQGKDFEPIRARAHVVRCTYLSEGFYDVATRFLVV